MIIHRELLLNRLIQAKHHHLIKILTGIRRCGKSFLLFKLGLCEVDVVPCWLQSLFGFQGSAVYNCYYEHNSQLRILP